MTAEKIYRVNAVWDDEAQVWVAESDDVPGLATGADSFEALVEKLKIVIPELLSENGVVVPADVPFQVNARQLAHARSAA